MNGIITTGIALLAISCIAPAPALGAEKKATSESKSAPELDQSRKGSKAELLRKSDLQSAPSRKDPGQQGNLSDPTAGNPAGAASQATERRAGRSKAPSGGGSSAANESLLEASRSSLPKGSRRAVDAGAPGSVANPAGDPLAKAGSVGSPAPTARELQDQSRAAKGDRTSQSSTVWRVDTEKPFSEQNGGVVQPGGSIRVPEKKEDDEKSEQDQQEQSDTDKDEEAEQADALAESTADCENVDENGWCYDKGDTKTRPVEGSATEYVTPMTDGEIAAYRAETRAGLVNPTEEGGRGELADPNRAREIGRSASPRAGWAINPGSGEAGGPAPNPSDAPERPDECDLAGGEQGGCGSDGDGLSQ